MKGADAVMRFKQGLFRYPLGRRRFLQLALLALSCRGSGSTRGSGAAGGRVRLRFKHQPLGANPAPLRELLSAYERKHPGVEIIPETLPNASDIAHQYFLTALEGGSQDFDVLVVDLIWLQEFARAGWIADLSDSFPGELVRRDFLSAAAEASLVGGRTFAVPWYVDVGLLYYRADLVPRAPKSYRELEQFTREALRADPRIQGFLWQGRQYEGLVCNVYEAIWGHGGSASDGNQIRLETPEAVKALGYLRSLIMNGLSPASVTSAAEEESRRRFQKGGAVFMRNWPYAWAEAQRGDSAIQGRVGFASLPTFSGEAGHGALGGWHLALNARSAPKNRDAAVGLIEHLTSLESCIALALAYGRNPPRRAAYSDPRLVKEVPFMKALQPVLEAARSRPATPYYNLISDVLQSEFSAAIAGVRSPDAAVRRAQRQVDRITAQA